MEKAVSSDEIVGESANSTSKESHWEFLRHQLRTATNYTNAVESFKTNVLSNHLGESRSSFENWVKVVNNVAVGMTPCHPSDPHCTCGGTCSNNHTNDLASTDANRCSCNCSNCYHRRPENSPKPEPPRPEYLTHIKHVSHFQC